MKKLVFLMGIILISAAAATAQITSKTTDSPTTTATEKKVKPAKPAKKLKVLPTGDAEIKTCIDTKLAKSKMATENFVASVATGVVTFTGSTKVPGHKGGVSSISKSCGATSVINNITVEGKPASTLKPKATKTPAAAPTN